MPKPRVSSITVENVLGLEKLEVKPGAVTLVTGRNGQGKTSFLEAIRSVLRGGHDASLLRRGAEKGAVRIVREDGVEILKRITAKSSPLDVRMPGVGKVSQGQAVVDALCDELAIDPLALITARPKDRARFALDVIDIQLSDEEIAEAALCKLPPAKGTALERLEAARRFVYDERTASNRTARDKRATEAQLLQTLPPDDGEPPDPAALRAQKAALEADRTRAEREAEATLRDVLSGIKSNAQAELDSVRADAAERIRAIERERDAALDRIRARAQEQADESKASAALAARQAAESIAPDLEALTAEIARQEAAQREHARAEKTREIMAATVRDAAVAEMEAAALTEAIARLDALKAAQLEKLPIPGLEARADDLYFDGLPFERLNSARQIELAVRLAALRAGDTGLVIVDHGEALDAEGRKALTAAAAAAGIQLVLGVVDDGPLTITTEPTEIAA